MPDSDHSGDPRRRSLIYNPTTYAGAVLAVISAILIASLFLIAWNSPTGSPYLGIITYLVLPAFLVIGLLLIPLGMGIENRRRRRLAAATPEAPPPFPRIDLNQPRQQLYFGVFAIGSLVAIALLGTAAYQSYNFMDSTTFCGQTCHTVMQPEYTAYLDSPHARVTCTACHIGPGASWYVRSKASGVYQVYATIANVYPRPITTPIENLRPARETCEKCHWPAKFYGDTLVSHTSYSMDQSNTPQTISLIVKTGGTSEQTGVSTGVHWHIDTNNVVRYVATDDKRQDIAWVSYQQPGGPEIQYFDTANKLSPQDLTKYQTRVMDCIDCHNRPTHIFYSPDEAVDREMAAGRMDPGLPFAKKTGVELITKQYPNQKAATAAITAAWDKFYQDNYPQVNASKGAAVRGSGLSLADAYTRNVFPQMNVTWGTYLNNLGHQSSAGCFRCHDGKHVSQDGRTIPNNCNLCHSQPVAGAPTGITTAATQVTPTAQPSPQPTAQPTSAPTQQPTAQPTQQATAQATAAPQATAATTKPTAAPTAAPTQAPAATPAPVARGGGLHNAATHSVTPCSTCHKGTPGQDPKPGRDQCTTCHTDRANHNPGIPCYTCHSFK
ncbi:MAG: NapC/NirT family cytochrome c [Chloroflexi bacterium]|nr:NapC/NirT family cytochrome c [Chloroflexota bacterium]MCL5107525.1 NapC/NirT family cytochrome c [Chloroflexota bacterium]